METGDATVNQHARLDDDPQVGGLSPEDLLRIFERPALPGPSGDALALLAAWSGEPVEELAELSLGRRDERLLRLYRRAFGPAMEVHGSCPGCGEQLELALDLDLLLGVDDGAEVSFGSPLEETPEGELERSACGESWRVRFRAVTSADLEAVAAEPPEEEPPAGEAADPAEAVRRALLRRTVSAVERGGEAAEVDALPPALAAPLAEAMAELDPFAEVLLALDCPACGRAWEGALDAAASLGRSLDRAAGILLAEVHTLARAYGWREADILALSPIRRRTYLEILGR